MAENTPDNLFNNYGTKSLENIFYRLCISEKKKRAFENSKGEMTSKLNSPTGEKPPLTSLIADDTKDKSKNFYFYDREL